MIDTKNFKPLKITGDRKIDVFSQVDGLSLQSVFFAEFDNIFPNLYTYRTDEAHISYTFDTKKIMEELGRAYGDGLQLVVYTVYNIQTKKEEVGLNFVLPEKKIVGRIETSPAESYLEYTHGGEEEVEKLTEIFLRHFRKPDLPPNNVYTVAYENGYFLNKLPTKDFSGLRLKTSSSRMTAAGSLSCMERRVPGSRRISVTSSARIRRKSLSMCRQAWSVSLANPISAHSS